MPDVSYPAELTPFDNEVNFEKIHEVSLANRGGTEP